MPTKNSKYRPVDRRGRGSKLGEAGLIQRYRTGKDRTSVIEFIQKGSRAEKPTYGQVSKKKK